MADGLFYWDSRAPHITGDITAVTLATTDKALYPVANFPTLGSQYWNYIGKGMRICLFGRITTVATPGNGTFDIYYGSGADATGTILASSGSLALSINQTNVTWYMECSVRCRAIGGAGVGSLMCTGFAHFNVGVLASTLQPMMIPATAPVAVSVDLTAANIISVQFKRSGSTAETMQVHEMAVISLN
jgi:hypothetical protein